MPDENDLVSRLWASDTASALTNEAAREIERLRDALRPFASLAPHYPQKRFYGNRPTTGTLHQVSSAGLPDGEITIEDIHRAAELIGLKLA